MHNSMDKAALERVMNARADLIMTRTFYGVLVSQVEPVVSQSVPTMATNGKQHFVNPEFIAKLTQEELLGVQAHESEHDARRHHTRRGWRDPVEWNVCTDYAINIDLVDQGFKLPAKALVDAKYRGMSAEDIYRTREIERAEQERQKQQSQEQESDGDDDESEPGDDGDSGDAGDDESSDDDKAGDEAGNDGDESEGDQDSGQDGNDDAEGDEAGDGNGEPSDDEAGQEAGQGGQDGDQDGDAGDAEGDQGEAGNGDAEAGQGSAGEAGEPQSSGDPGGCGEVLDAAETVAEVAAQDAKWETILRQASMLASKRGDAPGHVAREIDRCDHPPQDWRETLRAYFDNGATVTQTWSRPNRRFIGGGLYMPGNVRDGVNKVVFMIDTSGSVTYYPGALEAIKIETQAALDERIIDEAVVMYGDVQVTRVDEYRNGDEIEFDPRGGGGTDLRPMFTHVAKEIDDASLIVGFTDLEIGDPGAEPHCPVLWAVVGYPASAKHYMANPPWGAAAIEVRPDA